jgi:hypothetical protein
MKNSLRFFWCLAVLLVTGLAVSVFAGTKEEPSPFAIGGEAGFFESLDLTRPDLASVRAAVEAHDWPRAKQAWAQHLEKRTAPCWIWSHRDRPMMQKLFDQQFGGLARFTNAADKVLARDFTLLGVRKQLGHKVQWLQGPVEWTHVLSRFGYWNDLGCAYWGTDKGIYAQDFVDLLEDWINSNPVPKQVSNERGENGSVWRTLEAGIRGQSWFDAMEFFMDAPQFDAQAKFLMSRSLLEHANYLSAWETAFRAGNWQVCEASGLITIGIMMPEFKAAAGWRQRGLDLLVEHMQRDVEPDGMHWELTPVYHSWVMNEFLKVSLLCQANHIEIPGLLARHEKMFEVLEKLARPNRTIPPIGDAGTGTTSIEENIGLGALLYHRPDFRYLAANTAAEDWVWLLGPEVFGRYAKLDSNPPDFTSVLLPNAGYAVMRSGWGAQDKYLLFDCAPWRGGHSHQDRLQVTVFAGRDLIVDSGMCSYDEPVSRQLRLSSAHNVVMIDGQEQLAANPKLLTWHTDRQTDFASAEVEAGGFVHQRSVLFVKNKYWVVVDRITGQGEHEVTRLFHFPIGPAQADGSAAQTAFPDGMNIRVQPVDAAKLEMRTGLIATGLVSLEKAPVAALISNGSLPQTLCTVLMPYATEKDLPQVKALSDSNTEESRIALVFPNGQRDEIVIAPETRSLAIQSQKAQAQVLCVRQGPAANSVIAIPGGVIEGK